MNFRKLKALAIGSVITLSTLGGAMALDLNTFPDPIIKNNIMDKDTAIVVGATAAASDTLGAVDIAQYLQNKATKIVTTTTTTGTAGSSEQEEIINADSKTEEVELGQDLDGALGVINHDDLSNLWDGDITVTNDDDETDVKTKEEIIFTSGIKAAYSGVDDSDLEEVPALEVLKDSVSIRYTFEKDFEFDENFKINFQDKDFEISEINEDKIVVQTGKSYYLKVDESVNVENHIVKLINVNTNGVVVSVDNVQESISDGNTEKVNGISIHVEDLFYDDVKEDRNAELIIGNKVTTEIESEDSATQYGEPSDEDDAKWIWKLGITKDGTIIKSGSYISLSYNQKLDEDDTMLKEGDSLKLPSGTFLKFKDTNNPTYIKYTFSVDGDYVLIDTSEDDGFQYDGGYDDKVYVNTTGTYNSDYELIDNVMFGDSDIELTSTNTTITIDGQEDITTNFDLSDISYEGSSIKTREENVLTKDGTIVESPEDNIGDNEIILKVGDEPLTEKISIYNEATGTTSTPSNQTTTTSTQETTSEILGSVTVSAVLDSEIISPETKNLIIVGGPAINSQAARLIGTADEFRAKYTAGQALIKLVANGDKVAIVVAGYDAADTRRACKKIVEGGLTGTELVV